MIDRRILLASVAGLFGLAAFRWLRAAPASAAEKFEIEKTASQGYLRLRRLRSAIVLLGDEIRERYRLAEFLSAARGRRRQDRGQDLRDVAGRNSLPPLRRPSRPRLRRRAEADRPALLHGRLCAGLSSGRAVGNLILSLRPAIVARPAIVPRSSDRGIFI